MQITYPDLQIGVIQMQIGSLNNFDCDGWTNNYQILAEGNLQHLIYYNKYL